ncbi:MAG: glycosyltransferase, partial [Fidelibacterota bacterium]
MAPELNRTPDNPVVSVVVVNYNVKDYLSNCLIALREAAKRDRMEVVVVDNHSFDGSVAMLRSQFPWVTVIENDRNVGFARAVNRGVERCSGTYIMVLNPDTVVQENTLSILTDYMEGHPEVGICGPKILNADGTLQLSCKRSFPTPWVALPKILGLSALFPRSRWAGRYNLTYLDPDTIHPVEAISGSCMFIRRNVFETVGPFDERFFMFGEDLDYCYRTLQSGMEVHYVPLTQIIHYKGESVKAAPFDSLRWFHDAMNLFVDKHFSRTTSLVTRWGLRTGIFLRRISAFISSSLAQFIPVVLDEAVVLAAFLVAVPLRFGTVRPLVDAYLPVLGVYSVVWLTVGVIFQLYSRYVLSYNRAMLSSFLGFLMSVAFTYFFKQFAFSRAVLLGASLLITLGIPGWRLLAHILRSRGILRNILLGPSPIFSRPAIIVGAGEEGRRIARSIGRRLDTGIYVVGFSDSDYPWSDLEGNREEGSPNGPALPPFLGPLESLREVVKSHGVRELIFTSDRLTNEDIVRVMDRTKELGLTYRIVPRERDILLGKASVEDISDFPFVNIEYSLYHRFNLWSKRAFDLVMALILLGVMVPVLLVLVLRFPRWEKVRFWGVDG